MTAPRPAVLGDSALLAGRALRLLWRDPAALYLSAFFPLILLLLMSVSFAEIVLPGRSYREYVDLSLPLFVAMGVVFAALNTARALHEDVHGGMDDRLRTLPVAGVAPLLGRIAADTVRNALTVAIVVVAGIALGFRFTTGPLHVVAFFAVPLLFGFGVAWFMCLLAVRVTSAETAGAALNALLLVLSFLSTGFVPGDDLASWARPIAAANPLSAVVEAMRVLAHGGALTGPLLRAAAWTAGLTLVCAPLAVRAYRARPAR
ncbi:ABC transporter permease [Actinomadura flavalba]|uniref:ABC transporter permease n=1 Tax=Actinomadura flavalba TaxID=1120938 RepID=UPI000378218B|nr:ABC transporter permease [Actinomadura flavalba]